MSVFKDDPTFTGNMTVLGNLYVGGSVTVVGTLTVGGSQIRSVLSAARTYYVRSDGNDSNTGLVNSAAGAFLTWARALVVVTGLDFGGQTVTIQNGNAAIYTTEIMISNAWTGGGNLVIDLGGGGIAASAGQKAVLAEIVQPGPITVQNGTLSTVTFNCLQNSGVGTLNIGTGLTFGSCGTYHIQASGPGSIIGGSGSSYTVTGGAIAHVAARDGGQVYLVAANPTFSSDVTFSGSFALADQTGLLVANAMTFTLGAYVVKGSRYAASNAGVIDTGGGGVNYFPGDAAGTGTNPSVAPWGLYV